MDRGEKFNSISHLAGVALALTGLVFLVLRAAGTGDPWKIVSCAVYGVTLVVLYVFSSLYHGLRGAPKRVLQKLDHTAIYLLIAGTYTPFTLVTLRGAWGWTLFGGVWGLAVIGVLQEHFFARRRSLLSVALYLLMGWLAVLVIRPLARALPAAGMAGLVGGGVFYTIGVVFYALDRKLSFSHEIFHVFVLAGSACHYFTILLYVV